MKKWQNTINKLISPVFLALLIVAWELFSRFKAIPSYILPAPSAVGNALVDNFGLLMLHAQTTLLEAVAGLSFAILLALVIAFMMNQFNLLKRAVYPLLVISQTIPIIALAPIVMIWFGVGILPKVLIVTLVCFFPIVISLLEGLEQVDPEQLDLLRVMGARRWMVFTSVELPSVLPYFFSGLKIAATYSIMGAVIGEWLGASRGLGIYITRAMHSFNTPSLFAAILVVVLMSIALFKLTQVTAWLVMPWQRNTKKHRS